MFSEKSAWVIFIEAARNKKARPAALIMFPPVAEDFRRPRWPDARTGKPNRIALDGATERARGWTRGMPLAAGDRDARQSAMAANRASIGGGMSCRSNGTSWRHPDSMAAPDP